jgi:single-stranded-DNA-specific exonuclease
MKERHIRLELAQEPILSGSSSAIRAVGWDQSACAAELGLTKGSLIDIAYRIRENDHPEHGGLEVEIAGMRLFQDDTQRTETHG